jgi:hypothetical protein
MCTARELLNPCKSVFGDGVEINSGYLGTLHPVNSPTLVCLDLKNSGLITLDADVFHKVTRLKILILRNNSLETLHYSLFSTLYMLQILDLSYNRLISLTDERLFKSQNKLQELKLSHNKLITIDAQVLAPLHSLNVLNLIGNPLICNCELRFTMMWCDLRQIYTRATCNEPCLYSGLPWTVLRPTERCKDLPALKNLSESIEKKENQLEITLSVVGISIALVLIWCSVVGFCLCKKLSRKCRKENESSTYDDAMRSEDYYYEYENNCTESRKKPLFVRVLPNCNLSTVTSHNTF